MDKEKIKGRSENELDDMVIFRLLDEVIEHGEEALPEMEDYLTATADSVDSPEVDVEASLKKFKTEHAEFFVKPRRPHHWAYRVCVAAAAVFVANTVCAFALGHSLFNYAAKWGAETFGFYRDDFPTSKDGKIIYYPDGSWEDRSNMPDYDHETYTALPENNEVEEIDPTAPLGSKHNLKPIEEKVDPEYADIPDTDLSSVGLQKTDSVWDTSHIIESFDIINADLQTTLHGLGITAPMVPTMLPKEYSLRQINIMKDYFTKGIDILADYPNNTDDTAVGIIITVSTKTEYDHRTIEKDDRAVIEYSKNDTIWYIMHNLQHLNAAAMIDGYEVIISGDIDVDEMKKIIDSIYQ